MMIIAACIYHFILQRLNKLVSELQKYGRRGRASAGFGFAFKCQAAAAASAEEKYIV